MSGLIWSSLSNVRLTGVEPGDRDEPEVVMKRQATGKNSKIPNIFQFHLPSSFLHSTPLKHGSLYIKIMMQLYQKAHTLYMNYQSIHFFSALCLFVCLYFNPYRRPTSNCGFYFFSLLSWEMMVCHFNWVCGDVECWGGGVIIISFFICFIILVSVSHHSNRDPVMNAVQVHLGAIFAAYKREAIRKYFVWLEGLEWSGLINRWSFCS